MSFIDTSTLIAGIAAGFSAGIGASLGTYLVDKLLLHNIDRITDEVAKKIKKDEENEAKKQSST